MNLERVKALLIQHEKFVPYAYEDSEGYLTIGVGRLIDQKLGGGLTEEEGAYLLENDIKEAEAFLSGYAWYSALDEVRNAVVVDMMFNLGPGRFKSFKKMIAAIEHKDWKEAAAQMLDSRWAVQVKNRALTLAEMMRSGQWPSKS